MKGQAYVSNLMSGTISVIDLKSRASKNIEVGSYPVLSFLHPHNPELLIVALHNYNLKEAEGALALVDLKSGEIQNLPYDGLAVPSGMAFDAKKDKLYVADEHLCKIHVHEGKTLQKISSLPAGLAPVHLDISSDGSRMAATNRKSSDLYVYDLKQSTVTVESGIASIHLGPTPGFNIFGEEGGKPICHPYDVKFSEYSGICYATDFRAGELLVIDVIERNVTHHIKLRPYSFGMTLNKAGTIAYICNQGSGSISVVDLSREEVIGEISGLFSGSAHCALYEDENQLLVTCPGDKKGGAVQFIDLETEEVSATIKDEKIKGSIGITIDA